MSYAYDPMKTSTFIYGSKTVTYTSDYDYQNWESKIDGASAYEWNKATERFGEETKFDLLRGMAVVGISVRDWNDVFRAISNETTPFEEMLKKHFEGKASLTWTFFGSRLAKHSSLNIHYPPLCPEWLFPYGYTQHEYMHDIGLCWEHIHADYYKPWATTKLGQDLPGVAYLKKIGEEARREIDQVARYGSQYLE